MHNHIETTLHRLSSKERKRICESFFKTGPGEYGEGDVFLGVTVPAIRSLSRKYLKINKLEHKQLLSSKYHEARLLALMIWVERFAKNGDKERGAIYRDYLRNTRYINNWDLVDLSSYKIVGEYLANRNKAILTKLAKSTNLWERRIAIISTLAFIKRGSFQDTFKISKALLLDEHDLIHKAVGWMLREVGKKDLAAEERFLKKYYKKMPRTMLRYAIEKFPKAKRQKYLKGNI